MADIFISYSQKDRATAQDLAEFLERCGYDVWWDYDLVGGVTFREQIKKQLATARAAIVIWSPTSVESNWVRDEAEEAMDLKKLLPTRTVELDFKSIPLGFRQLQTDPIDKPDRILHALDEFGVKPSNPPAQPSAAPVLIGGQSVDPETLTKAQQFASWEFVKDSKAPADFRSFIERFPASPFTELARGRLAALANEAWAGVQGSGSFATLPGEAFDAARVRALQRFAEDYAESGFAGQALRQLYSLEMRAIHDLDRNSVERLTAHLALFPNGSTAAEVRHRLAELRDQEAESRQWAALNAAPTRTGIVEFLERYPLGAHANDARRMLEPVLVAERRAARWAMIREQGFSEQLKAFIAEFATGPEVEEARVKLAARLRVKENEAWEKARESRDPIPLLKLLRDYPDGAHRPAALAALTALPKRLEQEARAVLEGSSDAELYSACAALFPHASFRGGATSKAQVATALPAIAPDVEPPASGKFRRGYGVLAAIALLAAIGLIAASISGAMSSVSIEGITITLGGGFAFALIAAMMSFAAFRWYLPPPANHARHTALLVLFLAGVLAGGQTLSSTTFSAHYPLVHTDSYIVALVVFGWAAILLFASIARSDLVRTIVLGATLLVSSFATVAAGSEAIRSYSWYWSNTAFAFGGAAVFVFSVFSFASWLKSWTNRQRATLSPDAIPPPA